MFRIRGIMNANEGETVQKDIAAILSVADDRWSGSKMRMEGNNYEEQK